MVEINQDNPNHREMLNLIEETLRENPSIPRGKIAEKVENPYDYSTNYLRENFLPSALKHLKQEDRIEEAKRVPQGGNDTIYWKVKQ